MSQLGANTPAHRQRKTTIKAYTSFPFIFLFLFFFYFIFVFLLFLFLLPLLLFLSLLLSFLLPLSCSFLWYCRLNPGHFHQDVSLDSFLFLCLLGYILIYLRQGLAKSLSCPCRANLQSSCLRLSRGLNHVSPRVRPNQKIRTDCYHGDGQCHAEEHTPMCLFKSCSFVQWQIGKDRLAGLAFSISDFQG